MKRVIGIALVLVLALALAACGNNNTTPETTPAPAPTATARVSGSDISPVTPDPNAPSTSADLPVLMDTVVIGELHMSTNAAFPPYEMIADDGSFEGIDVEIAGAIADRLGLTLVVEDMGFDAALLAAQNGQTDIVMAGVTVTDERLEVMDFSDSYATGVQVIIVKEGSPIQSVDDLELAEKIGCQKATTGYIYCSDTPENGGYGEDHVTAFDTGALAVMALVNGQVDAVVIDNEPAKAYVAENPGLKILDTEFAVEDYAIGFAKGNDALKNAVNAAMAELKAEGTFQNIVDKYIKAD